MKRLTSLCVLTGFVLLAGCQSGSIFKLGRKEAPGEVKNVASAVAARERASGIHPAGYGRKPGDSDLPMTVQQRVAVEEYLRRGHIEARQGRNEEAKRYYGKVIENDPENAEAHHRLAVIADKQRDYGTAERHYQQALAARPDDPKLLSDIGYSYFLQGRLDASEQYLSRALESDPSHPRALNNLALVYGTEGDYMRAYGLLVRTGSEQEAQEKMARLFPDMSRHELVPVGGAAGGDSLQPNRTMPPAGSGFGSEAVSATSPGFASRAMTAPDPNQRVSGNPARAGSYGQAFDSRQRMSDYPSAPGMTPPGMEDPANPVWPRGGSQGVSLSPPEPVEDYDATAWNGQETDPYRQPYPDEAPKKPGFSEKAGLLQSPANGGMPQRPLASQQPFSSMPQPVATDVRSVEEAGGGESLAAGDAGGSRQAPWNGQPSGRSWGDTMNSSTQTASGRRASGGRSEDWRTVTPLENGVQSWSPASEQGATSAQRPQANGNQPRSEGDFPRDSFARLDTGGAAGMNDERRRGPADEWGAHAENGQRENSGGLQWKPQDARATNSGGGYAQNRYTREEGYYVERDGYGRPAIVPGPVDPPRDRTPPTSAAQRLYEQRRGEQYGYASSGDGYPGGYPAYGDGGAGTPPTDLPDYQQFPPARQTPPNEDWRIGSGDVEYGNRLR